MQFYDASLANLFRQNDKIVVEWKNITITVLYALELRSENSPKPSAKRRFREECCTVQQGAAPQKTIELRRRARARVETDMCKTEQYKT